MNEHQISLIIFLIFTNYAYGQQTSEWDSIKSTISPVLATDFESEYENPIRQPLSAYGWEDGLHISRDGKHLYALYYPGDFLGWLTFFIQNMQTIPLCDLFGNTSFVRPYADTYEMDMTTNTFGCDSFVNVDILYAYRASLSSPFTDWQLSGIARPGALEGSPFPLFSNDNPNHLDLFLFTGNNDIWMIRNTTPDPSGIEQAIRLPTTINPVSDEFNADNPHLERLNGDTFLMVYEKYTDSDFRDFVYTFSYDNGDTWTPPINISTINPSMGKIEHPHLYQNEGEWFLYYSLNCDIYRSKQQIPNNWDSWASPELVIKKGNSLCVGEPTLTENGDISFVVVYENQINNNPNDTYDIDPWFLPKKNVLNIEKPVHVEHDITIFPNSFNDRFRVISNNDINRVIIYDMFGRVVYRNHYFENEIEIFLNNIPAGNYIVEIYSNTNIDRLKITKH